MSWGIPQSDYESLYDKFDRLYVYSSNLVVKNLKEKGLQFKYDTKTHEITVLNSSDLSVSRLSGIVASALFMRWTPFISEIRCKNGNLKIILEKYISPIRKYKDVFLNDEGEFQNGQLGIRGRIIKLEYPIIKIDEEKNLLGIDATKHGTFCVRTGNMISEKLSEVGLKVQYNSETHEVTVLNSSSSDSYYVACILATAESIPYMGYLPRIKKDRDKDGNLIISFVQIQSTRKSHERI